MKSTITIRKSSERGHANLGWLDTYHTFSFGDYHDERFMGFRTLRVINEDTIKAGFGFDMHPHKDMEIISYVVKGSLQHKDSLGNSSVIKAGNIQFMSAGRGVVHSEYNPSSDEDTHLLQIWIVPKEKGIKPAYQEMSTENLINPEGLTHMASGPGGKGLLEINQDAHIYYGSLNENKECPYSVKKNRGVWIQMIKGEIVLNRISLTDGDGASIETEGDLKLVSKKPSTFLLFDLV